MFMRISSREVHRSAGFAGKSRGSMNVVSADRIFVGTSLQSTKIPLLPVLSSCQNAGSERRTPVEIVDRQRELRKNRSVSLLCRSNAWSSWIQI